MSKLLKVCDVDDCGEYYIEDSYLEYEHNLNQGYNIHQILDKKPTLEEISDFLDQESESNNYHYYVGLHRLLSLYMYRHVGREKTTKILQEIAEDGGLPLLMFGEDDWFDINGIFNFPEEWDLNDIELYDDV